MYLTKKLMHLTKFLIHDIANNIPVQQIHSAFEHEHLEDDIHNQMRFDEIEPFLSQIDLSASIVKIYA